jgi:hypothetical protein
MAEPSHPDGSCRLWLTTTAGAADGVTVREGVVLQLVAVADGVRVRFGVVAAPTELHVVLPTALTLPLRPGDLVRVRQRETADATDVLVERRDDGALLLATRHGEAAATTPGFEVAVDDDGTTSPPLAVSRDGATIRVRHQRWSRLDTVADAWWLCGQARRVGRGAHAAQLQLVRVERAPRLRLRPRDAAQLAVSWTSTGDADVPYVATVGAMSWALARTADGYALHVDAIPVGELPAWPAAWTATQVGDAPRPAWLATLAAEVRGDPAPRVPAAYAFAAPGSLDELIARLAASPLPLAPERSDRHGAHGLGRPADGVCLRLIADGAGWVLDVAIVPSAAMSPARVDALVRQTLARHLGVTTLTPTTPR